LFSVLLQKLLHGAPLPGGMTSWWLLLLLLLLLLCLACVLQWIKAGAHCQYCCGSWH
jgi:putative effector of murein hydrolase LrgA (UPF0299 family)